MRKLLAKITPSIAISVLTAILTVVGAFVPALTSAQTAAVLVFGGGISTILFAHGLSGALGSLSPQTIIGLVTGGIGVAAAFGLNITKAQSDQILEVTGLAVGLLLAHGIVHTAVRYRRQPEAAPVASTEAPATAVADAPPAPQTVEQKIESLGSVVADLAKSVESLHLQVPVRRGAKPTSTPPAA